jgi:hypothetical protein
MDSRRLPNGRAPLDAIPVLSGPRWLITRHIAIETRDLVHRRVRFLVISILLFRTYQLLVPVSGSTLRLGKNFRKKMRT